MTTASTGMDEFFTYEGLRKFVNYSESTFQKNFQKHYSDNERKLFSLRRNGKKHFHYSFLISCMTEFAYEAVKDKILMSGAQILIEKKNPISCIESYRSKLEKIRSQKTALTPQQEFTRLLQPISWTHFITITPLRKESNFSLYNKMERVQQELNVSSDASVVYTIEPHEVDGWHIHLLLKSNWNMKKVKSQFGNLFPYTNIKAEDYVKELGALHYIFKMKLDKIEYGIIGL